MPRLLSRTGGILAPPVVGAALMLGGVFAQEYRIDTAGGPLTLPEEVAEAAAAWEEGADGVDLREDDSAERTIRFGDPERMGPDLVSATLLPEEGEMEIRLNPQLYRDFPASLLHELGLVLGLSVGSEGVMAPLLTPSSPTAPTEDDLLALSEVQERLPGDLDGDGVVGIFDLARLARAYGERGVNLPADLDGDGVVGAGDLELLRELYEFKPPAQWDEDGEGASGQEPGAADPQAVPESDSETASPEAEPEPAPEDTDPEEDGG